MDAATAMSAFGSRGFTIDFDQRQLKRVKRLLKETPKAMPRVMSRSINRTLTTGRKVVSQEVRKEVNIKAKVAKDAISLTRATRQRIRGEVNIRRKPIPLREFGARKTKKHGVSVKVRKKGPRKKLRGTFIVDSRGGHVFERQPNTPSKGATPAQIKRAIALRRRFGDNRTNRLPIIKRFGPTLIGVFENAPGVARKVLNDMDSTLAKNINSQVDFELSKLTR